MEDVLELTVVHVERFLYFSSWHALDIAWEVLHCFFSSFVSGASTCVTAFNFVEVVVEPVVWPVMSCTVSQ